MKTKKEYTPPECTAYEMETVCPIAQSPDSPSEKLPDPDGGYDGPLGYADMGGTYRCKA